MINVGPLELIIVLAIALLVVGPKKLPEVGRSVGKGLREFKGALANAGGGREPDPLSELEWDEHGELRGPELEASGDPTEEEGRRRSEDEEFERVQAEEEARAREAFPK